MAASTKGTEHHQKTWAAIIDSFGKPLILMLALIYITSGAFAFWQAPVGSNFEFLGLTVQRGNLNTSQEDALSIANKNLAEKEERLNKLNDELSGLRDVFKNDDETIRSLRSSLKDEQQSNSEAEMKAIRGMEIAKSSLADICTVLFGWEITLTKPNEKLEFILEELFERHCK